MAQSVDYVYQYSLKLIRKNQAGGLSATEFQFLWNDAQRSYFDDLLGRFQRQSVGKSGINTGLIENETIMTKLTPFTLNTSISISSGLGAKPDGFIYTLALRINGTKVFQIDHDTIWAVNDDVIDPPSIADDSYYYTEYGNNYSFLPNTVTTADLDYIKSPVDVVWGFTFDVNGRQVYDPTTSVQPEWDDSSCIEISKRALTSYGVTFKDADFENFGKSVQREGE